MRASSIGITERFYRTLFLEKRVAFGQNLYTKYYNRLWPCEQVFISFLRTENSQQQLEFAITIVEHLSFQANFPLPSFVFRNLISSENKGTDSNFIAQDHAIHTVNLYILGIFLFFNHQLFHTHLVRYFEAIRAQESKFGSPLEQSAKAFFTAWRIFSLYHDIGYVLERAADKSGYFNQTHGITEQDLDVYQNLSNELLYETLTRALSRALYADIVFRYSKNTLSNAMSLPCWASSTEWRCVGKSDCVVKGSVIKNKLASFGSFVQLFYIDTWKGLKHLLPFINHNELVTLVRDKSMRPVALSYVQNGKHNVYIKQDFEVSKDILSCLDCLERLGSDEFPAGDFICEYYVPQPNAFLYAFPDGKNKASFSFIASQCYKKFSAEFSMCDSARQDNFRFEIYRWLQHQVPIQAIFSPDRNRQSYYDADVLSVCIENFLHEKILQYKAVQSNNLEADIARFIKKLRHDLEHAQKDINDDYCRIQNMDLDKSITLPLRDILLESFVLCKPSLSFPILLSFWQGSQKKGKKIIFRTLASKRKGKPDFPDFLYDGLSTLAKALGLDIDTLLKYRPYSYSKYDHGVVSAVLVARTYSAYQQLCENVNACPLLRCAWPVWANDFCAHVVDKDSKVFIQSIFAILLHNIYGSKYNKVYGIDYMQDVSINPFSYFCALCDSLQFWNRPKLIDQTKTKLPEDFSTGSNFDLWVAEGKIYLDCNSPKMHKRVKTFDDFLSAASSIVVVLTQQDLPPITPI